MGKVNANKAGLALGTLTGGWHLIWSVLVAAGWAQAVLNFVFWAHFLVPPYTVQPFRVWIALVLIGITATIGYAMGYVLAALWNWLQQPERESQIARRD